MLSFDMEYTNRGGRPKNPVPSFSNASLTTRERQVVKLYGKLSRQKVAERLGITEGTVKMHLKNARQKTASTGVKGLL